MKGMGDKKFPEDSGKQKKSKSGEQYHKSKKAPSGFPDGAFL
jgi:hypothetical protein